jgi:uncharacterized protein (TIGR00297 family)
MSLLAAAAVAAAARRTRSLTAAGAAAATFVGGCVFATGGLPAAGALVAFFVTSSALSHFKQRAKARRGALAQAKSSERDAWQVLANGGVAALCLALGRPGGAAAFLGALATAGADTWATELGLLAPRPPRLVTTLRRVPPGASGGVTPEGTLASVGGALTVGATWAALRRLQRGPGMAGAGRRAALRTGAAGAFGALVDSLLGATVQAHYWCPTCAAPVETPVHPRCGQPATLVRGWTWVNNDVVNALATAAGALAGAALDPAGEALPLLPGAGAGSGHRGWSLRLV